MQEKDVTFTFPVGDLGANEDSKARALMEIPANKYFQVDAAYVSADATTAAANTDYNTVYIQNNDATYNTAVIASLVNGPAATGTSITAAPVSMGTPAAAYKVVGSTSVQTIYLVLNKTGNGQAIPGAAIHLIGRWIPQ